MSSNVLEVNFRANYARYVTAGKIVVKHRRVLPVLINLGRNEPVANTLCITQLDDQISTFRPPMIHCSWFIPLKCSSKTKTPLRLSMGISSTNPWNCFSMTSMFDTRSKVKNIFQHLQCFSTTKFNKKSIFYVTCSHSVCFIRPLDNYRNPRLKNWMEDVRDRERLLLLKVENQFTLLVGCTTRQKVFGNITVEEIPMIDSLQNKKFRSSAQIVEIADLEELEGTTLPKKTASSERSITPTLITINSYIRSFDGDQFQ